MSTSRPERVWPASLGSTVCGRQGGDAVGRVEEHRRVRRVQGVEVGLLVLRREELQVGRLADRDDVDRAGDPLDGAGDRALELRLGRADDAGALGGRHAVLARRHVAAGQVELHRPRGVEGRLGGGELLGSGLLGGGVLAGAARPSSEREAGDGERAERAAHGGNSNRAPLGTVRDHLTAAAPVRAASAWVPSVSAAQRRSRPASPRSTVTVSPSRTSPASSAVASRSPISRCTSRRSGRAP